MKLQIVWDVVTFRQVNCYRQFKRKFLPSHSG